MFKRASIIAYFGDKSNDYKSIMDKKGFYVENIRIPTVNMVFPEQTHSNTVVLADPIISYCRDISAPVHLPDCDAIIASKKGSFLTILTADCVPVLVYDNKKKVIAAVHSGREGTKENIVGATIANLQEHFNSRPDDINILIGPAISGDNYPVSEEIFTDFVTKTEVEQVFPNIDLKKVVKHQAQTKGVIKIEDISICTHDNPLYFSYRRDKTKQRQVSLIGIR